MFMNSVIDLTAYLPEQPAPRRRKRKFGSIAAAVETAVTLLMGVGFLLALTADGWTWSRQVQRCGSF